MNSVSSSSPANAIRILLLDQHSLVREGLCLLLERQPNLLIVGEAGERQRAIELARQASPDIILLELNLDCELDPEIITQLLQANPTARIILLTGIEEARIHHMAVQMGAMGVVEKTDTGRTLVKAIEKVHAGEVWIDRMMMAKVLTNLSRPSHAEPPDPETFRIAQLSDRELEVVALIGEGLKNKDIAERLTISEVTVRHHLTSIYNKLGVSDRLELIIYAYRNELVALPA
ncbi:MAG: response regulator transcription factor [Chloroflexota bacterium]